MKIINFTIILIDKAIKIKLLIIKLLILIFLKINLYARSLLYIYI